MHNILDEILSIQQQHPNIYVGGSVALILQEAIAPRKPKDVDLISTYKTHIYDVFGIDREKHWRIKNTRRNGITFDLFYNPNAQYVEYNYNGNIIKLSPVDETMEWKTAQLNKRYPKGYRVEYFKKHLTDLQYAI
jgi:hypothetical protein